MPIKGKVPKPAAARPIVSLASDSSDDDEWVPQLSKEGKPSKAPNAMPSGSGAAVASAAATDVLAAAIKVKKDNIEADVMVHDWRLVYKIRANPDGGTGTRGDIYMYPPGGKPIRSMVQLKKHFGLD